MMKHRPVISTAARDVLNVELASGHYATTELSVSEGHGGDVYLRIQ
jgi:hypothetical protein